MKTIDNDATKPKASLFQRLAEWSITGTALRPRQEFSLREHPGVERLASVLGSVAAFLFMLQAFTGILLAFNYAPTPGDAYNSLRYIITELTGDA